VQGETGTATGLMPHKLWTSKHDGSILFADFFIDSFMAFDLINQEIEGHCLDNRALQVFLKESEDARRQGRVVIKSLYYAVRSDLEAGDDGEVSGFCPYTTLTL